MEVFVVGGAVRDVLLGLEPKDLDFVVVGSTPEEMAEAGFTQVGADFPVFLDDLGREFALARTERKSGQKHTDFVTEFDPTVTLEDDLLRRDLTINAMAVHMEDWDEFVESLSAALLVDPHDGRHDLRAGLLRHVSNAFGEDPLRVLRVARFAARMDFQVSDSTMDVMQTLAMNGELNHLTKERVWKEMSRAMMEKFPHRFFDTLRKAFATDVVFNDESAVAFAGVGNRLDLMAQDNASEVQRWMSLFFDTDKVAVESFCKKHILPTEVSRAIEFSLWMSSAMFNGPDLVMQACKKFRVWHDRALLDEFSEMIRVVEPSCADRVDGLVAAISKGMEVSFDSLTDDERRGLEGPDIGMAIDLKRLQFVSQWNRELAA